MSKQQLLIGNCLDVLKDIETASIDVCITSPPYWGLRDYKSEPVVWGGSPDCEHDWDRCINSNIENGAQSSYCLKCGAWKGQLGLEPTPHEYVKHLLSIFDEVKRVLKPTGSCWVNIGDTYNGNKNGNTDENKNKKVCGDIKNKSLVQIPSRFAIAMTDNGWILRNECIWHKPNVMPQSVKDRFTVDFEKLFFFTKEPTYYFNQQKEPLKHPNVISQFGKQKKGNTNFKYSGKLYDATKLDGKNVRTTWSIPTTPSKEEHCAMFPIALIDIPIKSCCPQGGIILDPFCGSGTTLEYCRKHSINGIGIEINPKFKKIIDRRSMADISELEAWI